MWRFLKNLGIFWKQSSNFLNFGCSIVCPIWDGRRICVGCVCYLKLGRLYSYLCFSPESCFSQIQLQNTPGQQNGSKVQKANLWKQGKQNWWISMNYKDFWVLSRFWGFSKYHRVFAGFWSVKSFSMDEMVKLLPKRGFLENWSEFLPTHWIPGSTLLIHMIFLEHQGVTVWGKNRHFQESILKI